MSVSISNANLMYYYPFDTDTKNYASGTGVTDGSATNVSISNTTTKLTSGSISFPGASNSAFQIPDTTFTSNGITIMFWAKLNVLNPTAAVRIFDFGSGTGTYNFILGFSNNQLLPNYRAPQISTPSNFPNNGTAYSVSDTNWHHYCMTTGTFPIVTVYVDGVLVYTASRASYPTLTTITPCFIGKRTDGGTTYLNAYLNQFIIFNRVLSYSEIYSIYANPTGFQFVTVANPSPTLPLGSPLTINNNRLLAYYPFDTNILDYTTGTGVSNATATNASIVAGTTVLSSGSLYFSGSTTQVVSIKNLTFDGSGITFAFWMKIVKLPAINITILDLISAGMNNIGINAPNNGYLGVFFKSPSIPSNQNSYTNTFRRYIDDTNWHHYCITITNTGFSNIYLDGQNTYLEGGSYYPALTTYNSCLIGSSNTAGNNTTYGTPNIYMNQLLIYNRVITAQELFVISSFPSYMQLSSSDSNIQTYYDSYTAPKDILLNQPIPVTVKYTSSFLNVRTTYSLKNTALTTTYGSPVIYDNRDASFATATPFWNGAITVDESGNIYVGAYFSPDPYVIYVYNISGTLLRTITFPAGYVLNSIIYDPYRKCIYCGKQYTNTIFSVLNLTTYTMTDVSFALSLNQPITQFAISPSGVLYGSGISIDSFCTIDPSSGIGTIAYSYALYPGTANWYGSSVGFGAALAVTVDASGFIYMSNGNRIIKYKPDFTYMYILCMMTIRTMTCDTTTGNLYGGSYNGVIPGAIYKITPSGVISIFTILPPSRTLTCVYYDKFTNRLYATANNNIIHRFNLQNENQLSYTFSSSVLSFGDNLLNLYDPSNVVFGTQILLNVACFREGTLIRCLDVSLKRECYVPVENLTKETYVLTKQNGYKRVEVIGHTTICNPNGATEIDNRLFVYRAGEKNPTAFQDLYITGNHCALLPEMSDDLKTSVRKHMGDIYETDGFYRLPACLDERAEAFTEPGEYRIWHFALENDNVYANYGVLANGLLVETASIDYLQKYSGMTLL